MKKHLRARVLAALAILAVLVPAAAANDVTPSPTFERLWGALVSSGSGFQICTDSCRPGATGFGLSDPGAFDSPRGLDVDNTGNVYIADRDNHRIQKFDYEGNFVREWGTSGSGVGQFRFPEELAVNRGAGHVFVADQLNHRIQKFDTNGNFILEWGSNGAGDGQFVNPFGVAIDSAGNVYVADILNHRIQKFDANGNFLTKWGSQGNGEGQFDRPQEVIVDSADNVYVADGNNFRIQKFDADGNFLARWGNQGEGPGEFSEQPVGLGVDSSGTIYVTDFGNGIHTFDPEGHFIARWGQGGTDGGQFDRPTGIAVDSLGNVFVADSENHRIQKFDTAGNFVEGWGWLVANDGHEVCTRDCGVGRPLNTFFSERTPPPLADPVGITVGPDGFVYVVAQDSARKYDADGNEIRLIAFPGPGRDIVVDANGNIYANSVNFISKFAPDGTPLPFAAPFGFAYRGIALDSSGNVFVGEGFPRRINVFDPDGNLLRTFGTGGLGDGQFANPSDLAIDGDDRVYVLDEALNRVQVFDVNGTLLDKWGSQGGNAGQMSQPVALAIDPNGDVWVAELGNQRLQKFDRGGTPLGTWQYGIGPEEGRFEGCNCSPRPISGMAFDAHGGLYLTDTRQDRVQKFNVDGSSGATVTARDDTFSTAPGTTLTTPAPGVLANDEGAGLGTLEVAAGAVGTRSTLSGGSVSLAQDGSFTYTPLAGFTGTDSFTYQARAGGADSNTATATINVDPDLCSYSVSPGSVVFGPAGGNGSVTIDTSHGCTWATTSSESWISLPNDSSGTGPGEIRYTVVGNEGVADRDGSILAGGDRLDIQQAGSSNGPGAGLSTDNDDGAGSALQLFGFNGANGNRDRSGSAAPVVGVLGAETQGPARGGWLQLYDASGQRVLNRQLQTSLQSGVARIVHPEADGTEYVAIAGLDADARAVALLVEASSGRVHDRTLRTEFADVLDARPVSRSDGTEWLAVLGRSEDGRGFVEVVENGDGAARAQGRVALTEMEVPGGERGSLALVPADVQGDGSDAIVVGSSNGDGTGADVAIFDPANGELLAERRVSAQQQDRAAWLAGDFAGNGTELIASGTQDRRGGRGRATLLGALARRIGSALVAPVGAEQVSWRALRKGPRDLLAVGYRDGADSWWLDTWRLDELGDGGEELVAQTEIPGDPAEVNAWVPGEFDGNLGNGQELALLLTDTDRTLRLVVMRPNGTVATDTTLLDANHFSPRVIANPSASATGDGLVVVVRRLGAAPRMLFVSGDGTIDADTAVLGAGVQ